MPADDAHRTALKRVLLTPLAAPGVDRLIAALTGTEVTIFMCHRFAWPDLGVDGHDPALLRETLAQLRKRRYHLVSLQEIFAQAREGEPLRRAVAFTIDDGYRDHAEVAAPIFAAFDCPVTTFVPTGFLDGNTWFRWDKLMLIFETTSRNELHAHIGSETIRYSFDSAEPRARLCWSLNLRCQDASEQDRLRCVEDLSREAEVELPAKPPARFAPLSWDQARKLERQGMSFGPHTVTHPVLSTTPDDQSAAEIECSWSRLKSEVSQPVPVFCYPNGRLRDFGAREIATIRRLGLWGAVTGVEGNIRAQELSGSGDDQYLAPRFGYRDWPHTLQCVCGVETIKARLRGAAA